MDNPERNLAAYFLTAPEGSEYSIESLEPADIVAILNVLGMAYQKHHCGNDSIGWNELSDQIHLVICRVVGTRIYQKWSADCEVKESYANIT